MAAPFPAMRVDHVSIAVRAMGPTLARWQRLFPVRLRTAPRPGYDGEFRWTDFFLGDRKLELIESARPGSFVERFLAAYGQRWHHLSLDLEEGALDRYAAALERDGLRIVDRGDYGGGDQTAFISPRTAPGILVQFWQVPGFRGEAPADYPTDPVAQRDGIRFRAGPLTLAVRSIDDALAWFRRTFPVEVPAPKRPSPDGSGDSLTLLLAGYTLELVETTRVAEGFHHLTIDVDPLGAFLDRLEAEGIRPARGAGNALVELDGATLLLREGARQT
ncbi:MAG: hypothetical protein E6J68_07515 [Deltaproteobacteria bacterium]|nr:MAG: hypothetical protein E6J68_07515 [Deltaproteobacteria bacterium]